MQKEQLEKIDYFNRFREEADVEVSQIQEYIFADVEINNYGEQYNKFINFYKNTTHFESFTNISDQELFEKYKQKDPIIMTFVNEYQSDIKGFYDIYSRNSSTEDEKVASKNIIKYKMIDRMIYNIKKYEKNPIVPISSLSLNALTEINSKQF